jgi:hypothetical protein
VSTVPSEYVKERTVAVPIRVPEAEIVEYDSLVRAEVAVSYRLTEDPIEK